MKLIVIRGANPLMTEITTHDREGERENEVREGGGGRGANLHF